MNARRGDPAAPRRRIVTVVVLACLIGGLIFAAAGRAALSRVNAFIDQARAAVVEGDYHTDVGIRIKQAEIALALFADHPWLGVGAGSYRTAAVERVRGAPDAAGEEIDEERTAGSAPSPPPSTDVPIRHHPHSSILYAMALTGLPGLLLYLAFWVVLLHRVWIDRRRSPRARHAILPGLTIGLFVAFAVDCQNLSAPGMGALMLVTTIAMAGGITASDERTHAEASTSGST